MSVYSIWPYFVTVAAITLFFATPVFRFLDSAPSDSAHRTSNLDGIRGFLALSVMIDHAIVTYLWLKSGRWVVPPVVFYDQLGTLAVAVFFMITGFLFWGKMITTSGRPNFISLYINRVFRIGPVYLFAIAMMALIVLYRTGFALHQPLPDLIEAIATWSALGLLGGPDFNGYSGVWMILAGVTWTLKYEWYFYFSLVATARLATKLRTVFPAVAIIFCLVCAQIWPGRDWYLAALFGFGMVVSAIGRPGSFPMFRQAFKSAVALGLLALVFAGWSTPFGVMQVVLLGGFFYLICTGTTIFGLLTMRAAQRLGHISYSIYLLQGLVLTLIYSRRKIATFALTLPSHYWLVVCLCALILSVMSSATYVLIEQPGIRAGKNLAKFLSRRGPAAATQQNA
ncbi:peptidoglycan/LPS O-acetylase OafA/YrhL [Paraburkholderia sp. BL6669N2]|uniref:acyltransferase family protein n=1 Tax=Paraburkholderia sp. BL6669N2 TaxID=1938807 RepID=UPI000E2802A7|nr:acyltransferase [Paraburkholderia sp. BL6669N2]REG57765.1 peptidoglycan/LPS O-acetylase OafA/YrhL [Paraburkholderia sp. BL6669N2]